nr:hypothetical protein [uncultured Duganella sp.]
MNSPSANTFTSRHVGVAAEAFVAAVFVQCGYDISVQYGANQPEYDLIVAHGDQLMKVSVKGSKDGSWGLTQSLLENADYHAAADKWLARHKARTVLCFVQFRDVGIGAMPRIYLATPAEVAARLKGASGGRGDTILHERHTRGPRAAGAGTIEELPSTWCFTRERVDDLLVAISLS